MFINYWFVIFAVIFFLFFWLIHNPIFRKIWLLIACVTFHYRFAGPAGVIPIVFLGVLTYFAGIFNIRFLRIGTILLAILALIFYKYVIFLITQSIGYFNETLAQYLIARLKEGLLPNAPPLAISFFVFEFVHYLIEIDRGKLPIRSPVNFTLFSIFWPSVVAGPVKRFEQFLPALASGCSRVNLLDIQIGIMRIILGLIKKLVIADNLTAYINFWHPNFAYLPLEKKWIMVVAISMRILFDFSGYSDMAIGFARMMGIKLPENFNWPYLATNLQEFWRRWHISLSTWIRDYIYIPLGGSHYGSSRKIANGIIAFGICGLWHGAALNFLFWGVYHGIGLVIFQKAKLVFSTKSFFGNQDTIFLPFAWLITFTYVSIGWLYFFYPVKEATTMLMGLMGQ